MSLFPDISDTSKEKTRFKGTIDLVGFSELTWPLLIKDAESLQTLTLPGSIKAMVSLDDPHARGIHISRLFTTLQDYLSKNPLNLKNLKSLLLKLIESQEKHSSGKSYLHMSWDHPIKRKSLKSQNWGWRYYPVFFEASLKQTKQKQWDLNLGFKVTYSSTCPCSAGLARALNQEKFKKDFPSKTFSKEEVLKWLGRESSTGGTPHAQKSEARIKIKCKEEGESFLTLINQVEEALGTPVQVAVKRNDEQEFARLNAKNLLFSEDAARRIQNVFKQKQWVKDYFIHVTHFESLHPFEVDCIITKGTPNGFQAK